MSFYPPKSLRLAAAALVVFALTALALALPRTADAAARCTGKSKVWIVNGKKTCLKTARFKAGHAAVEPSARLSRWFSSVTKPGTGSSLRLPAKLRAATPRASAEAVKLLARAGSIKKKSRLAIAAASSPLVNSGGMDGPSMTLPSGVKLSSHVELREYEDGSRQVDLTVDSTYQGYTLRYQPVINQLDTTIPEVNCPTATGLLKIDYSTTAGGTLMVLKGKGVLASVTEKYTDTLHASGHVGRDAKLHDVDVKVTSKVEHYERGSQMVINMGGAFAIPREGAPAPTGPLSTDIKIRVAGLTSAQEREASKLLASDAARNQRWLDSLGSQAEVARWRMLQDEYKWYTLPGRCAQINYTPDSVASLAAGRSADVTANVSARAGGEASGDFSVVGVSRGAFSTAKAQSDPGSPAHFNAKAAAPDADKLTVESDVIATSTAGRAQEGWYARDDLDLPKKLSGTISSSSTTPGTNDYFHSWVVYTLDEVYVSDGGYISAWYKLTTADQDEVQQEIGAGCRWVAKGSGGNIEAGDIELNKAPGGKWQHAVMYDVEIPNATYNPTDCGPTPPPAFTGSLVGFVNMAMLGGGFEDVGENFHMEGLRVHEDAASQRKTVASWSFDPGDPQ